MRVHALILAGGLGSRLGNVRKGELRMGNQRLIDRVIARLGPISGDLLVSTGQMASPSGVLGITLSDPADLAGPMAGIIAGALYLRDHGSPDDFLVTVAVDTPFLPRDYVEKLVAASGAAPAFASYEGNAYPTNACWPARVLLAQLGSPLAALPTSPRKLLSASGAAAVDWIKSAPENPFANLNTLSDLIALSRRAANCDK